MGLKLLRSFYLGRGEARGDVLEACAGTGRNLGYYKRSNGVSSVTLSEPSREMLAEARQKAIRLSEGRGSRGGDLPRINFVLARAESLLVEVKDDKSSKKKGSETIFGPNDAVDFEENSSAPPLPAPGRFLPRSFDTVVDTFGLCSVEDPKGAVEQLARACKPGGKMIFIEHGRATTESEACPSCSSSSPPSPPPPSPFPFTKAWIDSKLDAVAAQHRRRWGCWWNRDLEAEIRGAAGVEVERVARWHLGTTLVVVARPRRQRQDESEGKGDG